MFVILRVQDLSAASFFLLCVGECTFSAVALPAVCFPRLLSGLLGVYDLFVCMYMVFRTVDPPRTFLLLSGLSY